MSSVPRRVSRAGRSTRTAEDPTVRLTPLSETWRSVDCGAVDAFENNAQVAVLARSATDAAQPILQTSVWGATHLNV